MKVLDELIKKLPQYAERYCKKIAMSIDRKIVENIKNDFPYLSDEEDYPITYTTREGDETNVVYVINVVGRQLAFLEFGTGIYNPSYISTLSYDYVPDIITRGVGVPSHGSYKKNHSTSWGNRYTWAFIPQHSGRISTKNGDYEITYSKQTYVRKKDGGISEYIYPLKKPVIITHGLAPHRMIYRAIQDTKREVGNKKL